MSYIAWKMLRKIQGVQASASASFRDSSMRVSGESSEMFRKAKDVWLMKCSRLRWCGSRPSIRFENSTIAMFVSRGSIVAWAEF